MKLVHLILPVLLFSVLLGCKKEEIIYYVEAEDENENKYGVIKGEVEGNTSDDSTAFNFSFKQVYDYYWGESWWEYADDESVTESNEINIWLEFSVDDSSSYYNYIWIKDWDYTQESKENIDVETYLEAYHPLKEKTLYYHQLSSKEEIEVKEITFNKENGRFKIKLEALIEEGNVNGSTSNPGTIKMSFSGVVLSGDVTSKLGKK